jgi:hypothetical protein
MSPKLKGELDTKFVNPLEYHFRKVAIREFRHLQDEEIKKIAIAVEGGLEINNPGIVSMLRPNPMVKNTVYRAHLEAEAGNDIDASLSTILEQILARPLLDRTEVRDWSDGVSNLWRS